ncbi:TRAP transporter substrate-binding protein [Rhodoplanes roseus]|uniref:C4-dicarboxylate ABC transporter n=1 Tax=Rhodoplanes roseus TaxID=29409 RepID=A0A327KZJ4_9BRAD|nr:TRAP transporter substrate-binding protein [Rhodoplanes roseus]RAI43484.1 C4-dicarboxylate ABC transporter [Rhodoplanes roseus]
MSAAWTARVFGLVLAAFALATAASAREFRAADNQVAEYPTVQALAYMGRLIEERTGGRHRIRVFHSRQLGDENDTVDQIRAGAIDINRVNAVTVAAFVPTTKVLSLPFLFRSTDHLHAVLDGPIGEEILASFTQGGFVGLAFYDSGARSLYTRQQPIRKLADLAGLRIRVQPSSLMADVVAALGATPIQLPYSQVETGLTTALVDGAENNWPSYVTTGHYKVAPYYTLTEHTMTPEVLLMSLSAWNALSDDDKAIFRTAARESSRFMRAQWSTLEERSREQARAAGNTIITDIDRKPFQEAMAPLYARLDGDPVLSRLVERIRATE